MAPDPYARYLQQAEELFAGGEIVRAGQIWQAVLKAVPDHAGARAGLGRVKEALDAKAELERMAASLALPEPGPATVSIPLPPPPAPEPEPAVSFGALELPVAPAQVPAPASVPAPTQAMDEDTQEKLLREGCTLYDMGQVEDALKKWDQLLAAVPNHAMALEYARGARAEVGEAPVHASAPAAPEPTTREVPVYGEDEEAADKLLREGCLLYDMGLPEEAVGKWEQAVKLAPHRADIQGFLDNARKDLATQAIPAIDLPTTAVAMPAGSSAADEKVRQGEHLLNLQRFEEAAFTFQQALDLDPNHAGAQDGLARSRARQSAPKASPSASTGPVRVEATPRPEPMRIEMDRAEPEPEPAAPAAVQPPTALTKPAPAPRQGLQIKAPEALDISKIPDWAKDPKIWAAAAGAILLTVVGVIWYQGHARDSQLQADVAAAHQAAVAKAARDAQVPDLSENDGTILSEGQQALSQGDAVRAYLRAQTLLKQNPSNGAAAQLLDKARASLPLNTLVGATAEEYQKHIQEGDLDLAGKVMDTLLRTNPDDPGLRAQAARLYLRLAEDHASQDRWSDAQVDLQRGRALSPEDSAWGARMALLPKIQGMPKGDRALWIAMLG